VTPDWLGSPQHLIGGAVVAVAVVVIARRWIEQWWLCGALAIGAAAAAEIVVELIEYPILYGGTIHASAYYDTIADMGMTLLGATLGTGLSLAFSRRA
jgi:hypothetical protein